MTSYHFLAKEILLQWTFTGDIVLQCNVSVCTKGTGQNGDVPKDRLAADSD